MKVERKDSYEPGFVAVTVEVTIEDEGELDRLIEFADKGGRRFDHTSISNKCADMIGGMVDQIEEEVRGAQPK